MPVAFCVRGDVLPKRPGWPAGSANLTTNRWRRLLPDGKSGVPNGDIGRDRDQILENAGMARIGPRGGVGDLAPVPAKRRVLPGQRCVRLLNIQEGLEILKQHLPVARVMLISRSCAGVVQW